MNRYVVERQKTMIVREPFEGDVSMELTAVHRKLMTSLSYVTDVLVSEIAGSESDPNKQQALQSAAADLAIAIEDIRALKRLRERILSQESSGILSYSGFLKELGTEIERAKQSNRPLGVLLLEFNLPSDFKHREENTREALYIEEAGELLKTICRKSDLLGRSAHHGYFLALVGAGLEETSAAAGTIENLFKNYPSNPSGRISYAIGTAVWPLHGSERTDLVFGAQQSVRLTKPYRAHQVMER
ncbi:MAG: hypothetical protein U0V70_15750 [Terriglobia bacterium]